MLFSTSYLTFLTYNYHGDYMNKKVFLISAFISLIFSFGILKMYNALSNFKTIGYLVQVGAYNNLDNAINASHNYNYSFVMKDNDMYKIYLALLLSDEAYNKVVNSYEVNDTSFKKVIVINDRDFSNKISDFDTAIIKCDSLEKLKAILKEEIEIIRDYYDLELIY